MEIRNITDKNTREFAEACYDMNSISELENALKNGVDDRDCHEWRIDKNQWKTAVNAALAELRAE